MKQTDDKILDREVTEGNEDFYRNNGYLVVPDLVSKEEVEQLKQEALEVLRGHRGTFDGLVPTDDGESEIDTLKKYLCINFPHKISTQIKGYLSHPKITAILSRLISPNVKCMQSMLFIKPPGRPGQGWHQDEFYIATRDRSLTGVWIAMDDATIDNGCLWVIPGSHKPGVIWPMGPHHDPKEMIADEVQSCDFPYTREDEIPVEVESGGVVFFNGYLLHRSLNNVTQNQYRRSLVNHYMSAESLLPWHCGGRVALKEDVRDIVMVAGEDPYAYKGTEEIAYPDLRPLESRGTAK